MMVDLNDMKIFAKVAETQGISAAARLLQMPKSKVSRRMSVLEGALGARLLERSTRAVHLTELGNIYYQHCRRIVEEAECASESVNQMLEKPRGHLRVSASITMGQHVIAPKLSAFMHAYPDIDVDIDLSNRRVDVIAEGFDLVVRVGELEDSSLISKRLGTAKAQFFASPQYLKHSPPVKNLDDLLAHRALMMQEGTSLGHWIVENSAGRSHSLPVLPAARISDPTMLRNVAEGDGGIALLPTYLVDASVAAGRLQLVLPEWYTAEFHYYAVYPSRQGMTRKVRAWIDFFSE